MVPGMAVIDCFGFGVQFILLSSFVAVTYTAFSRTGEAFSRTGESKDIETVATQLYSKGVRAFKSTLGIITVYNIVISESLSCTLTPNFFTAILTVTRKCIIINITYKKINLDYFHMVTIYHVHDNNLKRR